MKRRMTKGIKMVCAIIGLMLVLHYAKDFGISLLQRIGAGSIVTVLEDLFDTLDCVDMLVLIRHLRKHEKKVNDKL